MVQIRLSDKYEQLVYIFTKENPFINLMQDWDRLGVFIYDSNVNRIVFADHNFLQLNNITLFQLQRPGIRRLLFSKLHDSDVLAINDLIRRVQFEHEYKYINRIIGIKHEECTYKYCHFLMFNLKFWDINYKNLRFGLQIELSSTYKRDQLFNKEIDSCKKVISNLSSREKEILRLIVKGYTDYEIGCQLFISAGTVSKHRKNILKKVECKNTACLSFIAGKAHFV